MSNDWIHRIKNRLAIYFNLKSGNGLKTNLLLAFPFWMGSFLVGLTAVGYTKLFAFSEHLLREILQWHSWIIFIMAPACFILAWIIVQFFAPNAKGSGIPQVMAAIELSTPKNDDKVNMLLSFRIMVTKIVSSLLMVLGGGAIGREGPTIQIAGSIFRVINKLIPASWPKLSKQSFILTGAAAGLAAAFNTPLGGIVFAIEELSKTHIRYFQTALFSAVIIAGLTAQGLLGPYLYLGYPDVNGSGYFILIAVILTALLAGIFGSLMGKCILKIMGWKKAFSRTQTICFVLCSGLLIAFLAFYINDKILGSGKELMNQTLFTDQKITNWHTVIMRIFGPIVSFSTGAAGGVFAPSLAAGASVGSFISGVFHLTDANANILILSGMVGFLTGVTRTPFTSAILVLEMTNRHNVIFQLMLAGLVSNIAAVLIDKHSLYEQLKKNYVNEALMNKQENSTVMKA